MSFISSFGYGATCVVLGSNSIPCAFCFDFVLFFLKFFFPVGVKVRVWVEIRFICMVRGLGLALGSG